MTAVLIIGIDGLQPAQITPEFMPYLSGLASEGVTFANHHSVFPTVTRANTVSMVTGRYPGGHGLAANTLVVREFHPHRAIPAMRRELTEVMKSTGRLLLAPTLADILAAHDKKFVAVNIGSSGNAFLQNPVLEPAVGGTIHPEFGLPPSLYDEVVARFGPWPKKKRPDGDRLAHAVRVLTQYVVPDMEPDVVVFWSSEPDSSQHAAGVGSERSNKALRLVDEQVGVLLAWLVDSGRAGETDVIVVSDHGYSTVKETVDVEPALRDGGFPPGGAPGGVTVASNGGAVLFYVHRKDPGTADRLAAWLMAQRWCGPLVASEAVGDIQGALPADLIGVEGERAPDLAMSFGWDSEPNEAGMLGHAYCSGASRGLGMHGSMSRQEMRCVLVANGPNFRQGIALGTPSGNVDLAPTVLRLLGLSGAENMDGRVLDEALLGGAEPGAVESSTEIHQAEREVADGVYRQSITVSRAGKTAYVVEGSGRYQSK